MVKEQNTVLNLEDDYFRINKKSIFPVLKISMSLSFAPLVHTHTHNEKINEAFLALLTFSRTQAKFGKFR